MGNRWLIGVAVVVAAVAVGGVGFAQFTTSAYLNGSATAGTLGPLTWGDNHVTGSANSYNNCWTGLTTTYNTSDTLIVGASVLAPGDWCSFSAHLRNHGTIPANVYAEVTCAFGSACDQTYFNDTFAPTGESYGVTVGPITIAGGGFLDYSAVLTLSGGLGNAYQGTNCEFVITFSATAGT